MMLVRNANFFSSSVKGTYENICSVAGDLLSTTDERFSDFLGTAATFECFYDREGNPLAVITVNKIAYTSSLEDVDINIKQGFVRIRTKNNVHSIAL